MADRRPQRLATFDYVGMHRYFVTWCVAERRAAFTTSERVEVVREQIVRTCSDHQFEEIASVYMPDHVHTLVRGLAETAAFVPFMRLLRRRSSIAYRRMTRETLWQNGYYERVLRAHEDSLPYVDYIKDNPVQAGLVDRSEDYPFIFGGSDSDAPINRRQP